MEPTEFLDALTRLATLLRDGVEQGEGRNAVRALVQAWIRDYRPTCVSMLGDAALLQVIDDNMNALVQLAADNPLRVVTISKRVGKAKRHFLDNLVVPLTRAYWSRAPERTPAGRDADVARRLRLLDGDLAESYEQAVLDVEDDGRLTYRGPAGELREVLTGVLHTLAPTADVQALDWYKEARKSGTRKEPTPTRAERVRFILRRRAAGDAATEAAETFMISVEERLAGVVNATYKSGSAATHVGTEQEEVAQLLQYINALLKDLLPR
jgi:hypothetical protein